MQKWKTSFLVAFAVAVCFAQTANELEAPQVNRVAEKLACPCGCALNMTCKMEPYMCGTCKRAKTKIIDLQQQGKSDQQILNQFVQDNGKNILVTPPGAMGVAGPAIALVAGLGIVMLVLRKLLRSRPSTPAGPAVDDATLDRIDKEMSKLD